MEQNKKEKDINMTDLEKQNSELYELEEEKDLTIDDIENAPEDPDELFSEPPTLDLDFDEEPTDDELKLEEMDLFDTLKRKIEEGNRRTY